ncbi:hypothetical protein H70357_14220 [Paenibacillus sp. FSL H7-0357]|uniref:hypothetical protein n=1 Tax=unclassified Paenibacillus TaxID=185978 RepID=UPI0004F68D2F|nr:hypothetical protein [Paenibacillus sp. FSL H7-0357]AIQ17688.1 hypothetical protein H70357_14220 [Paenibacillus sp. FSL H7-0357]
MYNRGIACCLSVVLAAVVFAGCGVDQKQKDVYGNNKVIVQSGDSLTYKDRIGEVTAQDAELNFTGFYGSDTLWSIEAAEEGKLGIEFEQDITKGKFKVVLITPEEETVVIAEGSAEGSVELPLIKGNSRIKIVGNKGKGNANLHLTAGKGIEVDTVDSGGW